MTVYELVVLVGFIGYAVYRQSRRHELVGSSRFKMALIYIVVGLVIGGLHLPVGVIGYGFLAASIALSVVVGLIRGRYTRLWREADGRVYVQGTTFTIGIFVAMVVVKFGLGTAAYLLGNSDHGGIGEIVIMIGTMIAVQAELLWRRAQPLHPRTTDRTDARRTPSSHRP
ncbi:DUF1453 domain-containing protein [Williamsia muralis]|uniref:DUF1453 domain-containing protein n=1 Tax=Williamsia marianensis TaxID=85044 RepID=A0A2G3PPW4_WILMA|nr:DUF1453 domain-containing protein [Williamsia marianensis]